MTALLLDGKATAEKIVSHTAEHLAQRIAQGANTPVLTTVLVGDYAPSRLYVGLKLKMARRAGIEARLIELDEKVSQAEIEQTVNSLALDDTVNGILIQLPLSKHLDTQRIIELIPPAKDVDGLTPHNLGCLVDNKDGMIPCTPLGIMELIKAYDLPTQGKKAVIVGRSTLVSLPLALLLSRRGIDCTVTICHSRTQNLATECQQADLLITACGSPGVITADHVKRGAAIFDVGVSRRDGDGMIQGDVDFEAVKDIAGAITPMPGGTGPMTVACLIKNTVSTLL